jgi:hypothetical protein
VEEKHSGDYEAKGWFTLSGGKQSGDFEAKGGFT